jgi:nitric oxide reductase NorE protein
MSSNSLSSAPDDSAVRGASHIHPAPVIPGQPDMWVLVMIEALTFSAYFVVYTVWYRFKPAMFLQSQAQLDLRLGVVNTLIMLTSSWSIARCVGETRAGRHRAALTYLWITAGAGVLFSVLKVNEWRTMAGQGFGFETNLFFSFYYFLTGMHLLHVLVGLIMLGVVFHQLTSPARRSRELVETGATFWHMVDFLWVIIFTLLYVMR